MRINFLAINVKIPHGRKMTITPSKTRTILNTKFLNSEVLNSGRRFFRRFETNLSLLGLLILQACGGGSSKSGSKSESEPSTVSYSGAVIKGPLSNALVFLDYNADGLLGALEPSIRTNSDGSFSIKGNVGGMGFTALTDGTTIDTSSGEVLDNVILSAPAGASVVTPTTTIMQETGLSSAELSAVLGIPSSVDLLNYNPFAPNVDQEIALAVEKISQQVMTTVVSISSAAEGAGASESEAFSLAMATVVETVKSKVLDKQTNPEAKIDFSDANQLSTLTELAGIKLSTIVGADIDAFTSNKADLSAAIKNVNVKISEVENLTSGASKAVFSMSSDLSAQIKVAVEDTSGTGNVITFSDVTEINKLIEEKIEIGTVLPTISAHTSTAGTKSVTLTFSGPVVGFPDASDFTVLVNGAANTVTAASISGTSGTLTLTDGIPNSATVTVDYAKSATSSKQLKDAAGNAIESIGDPVTVTVTNDSTAPTVSSITTQKADGSYTIGETVDILIAYSEAVTVNTTSGSPTLKMETGTPDRDAVYVSGSGTDTLTFRYTVEAGDNTTDLDFHASAPFSLNGATIKDPAGKNADNTLVSAGASGSIGQANRVLR
jgi:hypothetical protein